MVTSAKRSRAERIYSAVIEDFNTTLGGLNVRFGFGRVHDAPNVQPPRVIASRVSSSYTNVIGSRVSRSTIVATNVLVLRFRVWAKPMAEFGFETDDAAVEAIVDQLVASCRNVAGASQKALAAYYTDGLIEMPLDGAMAALDVSFDMPVYSVVPCEEQATIETVSFDTTEAVVGDGVLHAGESPP